MAMSVNAPSEIMDWFYEDLGTGNTRLSSALCPTRATIEQTVDSGELVVVEGRFTGTHTGPLATEDGDVEPTGASVDL